MLELTGLIRNVLVTPEGVTREGEKYGGRHQVQVEVVERLRNGHDRIQVLTLGCDEIAPYSALQGQQARIPVGVFARGGNLQFYIPQGSEPSPAGRKQA